MSINQGAPMGLKKTSKGTTLIATMIGLSLGIVCIMAMLSLMQTVAKVNVGAGGAARSDGAIAAGMMGAQFEVQKAGYGVESPASSCYGAAVNGPSASANTDVMVVSGASLSTTGVLTGTALVIGAAGAAAVAGNAMVWRWMESGVSTCEGLITSGGGLVLMGPNPCVDATAWAATTWTSNLLAAPGSIVSFPTDPTDAANPFTQAKMFKAQKVAACSPYGASTPSTGVLVRFGAGNTFTGPGTISTACLANVCQ